MAEHTVAREGQRSLARSSALRLASNVASAFLSLLAGIVVARRLGAEGKGVVSLLDFTATACGAVAAVGLGEALVTLVRRHGARADVALGSSMVIVAGLSAAVGTLFVLAASSTVESAPSVTDVAVFAVAVVVPASAATRVLSGLAQAHDQVDAASIANGVQSLVAFVGTAALVGISNGGPASALGALSVSWTAAAVLLLFLLRRASVPMAAKASRTYMREAVRLGVPNQVATVLLALAGRVDLLVVAALDGTSTAGGYSVALTFGQVVSFVAGSLAVAAYPRMAAIAEEGIADYAAKLCRTAVAASMLLAAPVAAAIPLVVPAAFGEGFRDAVVPSVILSIGGVVAGVQMVLGRFRAAIGEPFAFTLSLTTSIVVMLALDAVLVPAFGATGAAIASVASSLAGAAYLVRTLTTRTGVSLAALLPRSADFALVAQAPIRGLRQLPSSLHR